MYLLKHNACMLTPAAAEELILASLPALPVESLPLHQCSGAVLRAPVRSERDQPPFDRVTMDGIGIDSNAWRNGRAQFRVLGIQAAGTAQMRLQDSAGCLEVMTGAVLPTGCDCVIPIEQVEIKDGVAHLSDIPKVETGQYIHRRATDSRKGDVLLEPGIFLRGPEIAIAASAGLTHVEVSAQPEIMIVSTGDELVEPGHTILDHQIRRSNPYGLAATLHQRGFTKVCDDHLIDDAQLMRERLSVHLHANKVLILSGGVSMGRYDLVPSVLEELDVRQVFHRIAQRPGKPMWFGISATGTAVFALPGNPVSSLVCLIRYVIPALATARGEVSSPARRVALAAPVEFQAPLAYFLPVKLEQDAQARLWAHPNPTHGSGDFVSLAGTDGFVELPPGPAIHPREFSARFHPW